MEEIDFFMDTITIAKQKIKEYLAVITAKGLANLAKITKFQTDDEIQESLKLLSNDREFIDCYMDFFPESMEPISMFSAFEMNQKGSRVVANGLFMAKIRFSEGAVKYLNMSRNTFQMFRQEKGKRISTESKLIFDIRERKNF